MFYDYNIFHQKKIPKGLDIPNPSGIYVKSHITTLIVRPMERNLYAGQRSYKPDV